MATQSAAPLAPLSSSTTTATAGTAASAGTTQDDIALLAANLKSDRVREGLCPTCGIRLYKVKKNKGIRPAFLRSVSVRGSSSSGGGGETKFKPLSVPGEVVRGQCIRCNESGGGSGGGATAEAATGGSAAANTAADHDNAAAVAFAAMAGRSMDDLNVGSSHDPVSPLPNDRNEDSNSDEGIEDEEEAAANAAAIAAVLAAEENDDEANANAIAAILAEDCNGFAGTPGSGDVPIGAIAAIPDDDTTIPPELLEMSANTAAAFAFAFPIDDPQETAVSRMAGSEPMNATYRGRYNDFGQRHGEGELHWANGDRYVGMFEHDMRKGEGTLFFSDGTEYVGSWSNNVMHGNGTRRFANGNVYTGEYVNGKRSGQGRYYFANGDMYVGSWHNDQFNGNGRFYYNNGHSFEGKFKNGKREGRGKYQQADGRIDVYRYKADARVGEGVRWSADRKKAWRIVNGKTKKKVSLEEAARLAIQLGNNNSGNHIV